MKKTGLFRPSSFRLHPCPLGPPNVLHRPPPQGPRPVRPPLDARQDDRALPGELPPLLRRRRLLRHVVRPLRLRPRLLRRRRHPLLGEGLLPRPPVALL